MAVAGMKIILVGGQTSEVVYAFDPKSAVGSRWKKVADLPHFSYNMGCSVMGDGTKIMITTVSTTNNVIIFDTTNNKFTNAPIATNVFSSNLILIGNDNYLVAGGSTGSNTIYKYTPSLTPVWTKDTTASLLAPRYLSGTAVVDATFFDTGFLPSTCTGI